MNPFNWRNGQPSVMLPAGDSLGRSKRASDAVARKTAATGKNPGTIRGISKADRAKNRETAWARKSGVR